MNAATLKLILTGGRVTRFHARSFLKAETNAEHSFFVAWVCWWCMGGKPSANLLLAAMSHDLPEYMTGDLPSPTKKLLGGQMDEWEHKLYMEAEMLNYAMMLNSEETYVLKFADNLAGWLKCVYEWQLGNQTLINTQVRYEEYITACLPKMSPTTATNATDLLKQEQLERCWRTPRPDDGGVK